MGDAGGRAALYASTDLETMEREMQKIYDELKGHDGASAAEDLDSANSSLLKSRTATQMMAQIMGDLGPMLKDPMLQNHPLLAKYLAGDLPYQSQEHQTTGAEKEPRVQAPSTFPAVDSFGSAPKVAKNESEGTGKSESESEKIDEAKTAQEPRDPAVPVHEVKKEEANEGKEVEVDKLIHLFISGKKEKERVISVEKPLRFSAEHALSSALHEEQPPKAESCQLADKPSGEHAVRSPPSDAAPTPAASVTEEKGAPADKDPTTTPTEEVAGEREVTQEPVASPMKPASVSSPNASRAARESTARKRNPGMEKEMERIRRAVEEKKAQRQRNILSRNSDTEGMRSSSEIVLPTTKTSPAPVRSATANSASVSPAFASPASDPKDQAQDMPARPVQLGVLPKSISIKALNAMVVQAPVQVPVPVPVPVPLEEDIANAPTTAKSTSQPTNTGAASRADTDDQQSREGDGDDASSYRSPRVTFGPGKSAIHAKLQERAEEKDEAEKDQAKSDTGKTKAEEENEATTPRVLVGKPKADTLHTGWTRASPPKEKVKADHRKTLLDRRTLNLGPGSLNTPLKLAKQSTREDLASPRVNRKPIEESGTRLEEEEEEEIEESDDGKEEEDEASEYEDEGSDDEDAKKQKNKDEKKGSEEKGKIEVKESKDVEQDEGKNEVDAKPPRHQKEKEPENNSSKPDIAKSSDQPLKKSNSGVSSEIPSSSSKSAEAKPTENGLRFSRFGSASLVSAKRTYKLTEGNNTLGRGDVQIVLRAASVSRKHATITLKNGTAFIRDLGSTHGTRINDKPITAKTQLAVGDVIRLGSVRLSFTVESPLIEGVISKRSPAFHKSWQKRYCVLKRRQRDIVKLYYYRSKESRLPQGSVSMDQVVSVTDDEMGGSPTVFKIKTIMRVFEFQAKDEEERNMWINALRAVTGNKSGGNSGSNEVERSSPRHNPPPLSEEDKRKQTVLELPAQGSSDGDDDDEDSDGQGPSKEDIKSVNKMF